MIDKKNNLKELAAEKELEGEARVAEWKSEREFKKLEKRAERAETYADTCIDIAVCSVAEAEAAAA